MNPARLVGLVGLVRSMGLISLARPVVSLVFAVFTSHLENQVGVGYLDTVVYSLTGEDDLAGLRVGELESW